MASSPRSGRGPAAQTPQNASISRNTWTGAAPDLPVNTPQLEVVPMPQGEDEDSRGIGGGPRAGQSNNNVLGWSPGAPFDGTRSPTGQIDALTEIGITGLNRVTGFVYEELLPELRGERGRRQIRMMIDEDAVIGAVLFIIEMLCRQVRWDVEPASESNEDIQAADFIHQVLFEDMSMTWQDTIAEILTMLPWGWSLMETVYKMRGGERPDDITQDSQFDDGKIGIRKLSPRAQETLFRWQFDVKGEVRSMIQLAPPYYRFEEIFMERSLLFRTTSRKNNPEGRSVLRNAYASWVYARNIRRIEAIGIERDLAGFPMAWMPPQYLSPNANADQKAMVTAMKRMVTNIRRDEQEGAVFPLQYDARGNKVFDFTLINSGGSRSFPTSDIITRYEQRIAQSLMAEFIMLGMNQVGSFALASSKTDLFAIGIGTFLDAITDVLKLQVKRILMLNGMNLKNKPVVKHGDIENIPLNELAQYITALSGAGFPLFPSGDGKLEKYLLDLAGLPAAQDLSSYASPIGQAGQSGMVRPDGMGGYVDADGNPIPNPMQQPGAGGTDADGNPVTDQEQGLQQQRQQNAMAAQAAAEYHQTMLYIANERAHQIRERLSDREMAELERQEMAEADRRTALRQAREESFKSNYGTTSTARELVGSRRR